MQAQSLRHDILKATLVLEAHAPLQPAVAALPGLGLCCQVQHVLSDFCAAAVEPIMASITRDPQHVLGRLSSSSQAALLAGQSLVPCFLLHCLELLLLICYLGVPQSICRGTKLPSRLLGQLLWKKILLLISPRAKSFSKMLLLLDS